MVFGEKVSDIKKKYSVGVSFNKLSVLFFKDLIIFAIVILIFATDLFPFTTVSDGKKNYAFTNIAIFGGIVLALAAINKIIEYFLI
jgi:hypothetical protein